jgi:hypothetical protein
MSKLNIVRQSFQVLVVGCVATFSFPAHAQSTCGEAQSQLQNYVNQVNYTANLEWNQGIFSRCGGQPYCTNTLIYQLHAWYAQQGALVNQWYRQLALQCANRNPSGADLPSKRRRYDPDAEINEESVAELEIEDEDKDVAIVIPETPDGFTSRRTR